jgi:O-antigen/teichoic acid export membrane protein
MQQVYQHFLHFINSLRRGIYILLSNLLEKAAFFLIFLFIARLFSKDVFGLISASFAFANIIASIFEGGLNFYFQRESAVRNPNLHEELNNGFNLRLILFIPYVIITGIYFKLTGSPYFYTSFFIALAVFAFSISNLFNAVLFGQNRYKSSFIYLLISRSILIFIVLGKLFFGASIEFISFLFALSGILHAILLWVDLSKKNLKVLPAVINKKVIKRILVSALPMGIGMIMVWIYDRVDVVIIQNYLGYSLVAIYAVAYSLYKLPQSFANFILTPLFSELSVVFDEKGYLPITVVKNKVITLLIFTIPVVFLLYYLSGSIIAFLYSRNYLDSVPLLQLLVICIPGLLLNNFTGTTLNSCRKERIVTISVFWAAIINIALNIILISHFRLMGAVVATIITEYFTFFFQFVYILKNHLLKEDKHTVGDIGIL